VFVVTNFVLFRVHKVLTTLGKEPSGLPILYAPKKNRFCGAKQGSLFQATKNHFLLFGSLPKWGPKSVFFGNPINSTIISNLNFPIQNPQRHLSRNSCTQINNS
jgi:hypothetical protein